MRFFLFFLLFLPISALSQVNDNFTDGDFTSNPTWTGNTADFIVNASYQCQLNSLGTDTSFLSTPHAYPLNNTEWRFWIRLGFSPSDNNYARIYLVSDQANLKGPVNGYFLRLGENGSDDGIDLWKQSGSSETKIIDGIKGHCAKSSNTLMLKVIRDSLGNWSLFSDTLGGINFSPEGSVNDLSHTSANYFGIYCRYTSSNAAKFYFDDFYIGPVIVDNTAPVIDSLDVINANTLDVYFDEPVDKLSAETSSHYFVSNGVDNPVSASRDASQINLVHLIFANPFSNGVYHQLSTSGIKDLSSNIITASVDTFLYYMAKPFDVVINEIMADPDPAVGLPNYEYLELYNTCSFPITLSNWTFTAGSNTKTIPSFLLLPDSFVVLTSSSGASSFNSAVRSIGLTSFPALTNSGQTLTLRSAEGTVISTITYSDTWYKDVNKEEGGWSLEQIDPENPCGGENNWKVSQHLSGGTPGEKNSVLEANADNKAPMLMRVGVLSSDSIQLFFDESLDSSSLVETTFYTIDNNIGNPLSVKPVGPDYSSVLLLLPAALKTRTIYNLNIAHYVSDCKGNALSAENAARFAIPEPAANFDLVINEVLYEPRAEGVEFVEIYNRSDKVIDLNDIRLSSMDTITASLEEIKIISDDGYLIFPGEYCVLSTSALSIKNQYPIFSNNVFIDMSSFPSMNNDGDVVVLSDATGAIIDQLSYSPEMHFALLNETNGISLERIDFNRPAADKTNWHSAAASAGYATPGYENSQYMNLVSNNDFITIEPEIFSPDNDGYNDVVTIGYQLDEPGFVGNITIFDSKGGLVKYLVRNELMGAKGAFSWDGTTVNNEKAGIGIYISCFLKPFIHQGA